MYAKKRGRSLRADCPAFQRPNDDRKYGIRNHSRRGGRLIAGRWWTEEHQHLDAKHDEAERVRHVIQIEGIRGRKTGDDADLLDAEEHEGRPEEVEQLHGDEQDPERNRRLGFFGREADTVVADEHGWELAQGPCVDNWGTHEDAKAADCSAAFLR